MLSVELKHLIIRVKRETGRKLTLGEISEGTGIHRNILSRLMNRPEDNTSSMHIDKLVEYFFYLLCPTEAQASEQKLLVESLLRDLVRIFPAKNEHSRFIESIKGETEGELPPMGVLWNFYALAKEPDSVIHKMIAPGRKGATESGSKTSKKTSRRKSHKQ